MLRAVQVFRAPGRGGHIVSFLAIAASLILGAHSATAAQSAKDSSPQASFELHGGLFSPTDAHSPSPSIGVRLSKLCGPHLQIGALTGWTFRRKNLTQPQNDGLPGPAPKIVLARADEHLTPLMGFVRINLTEKHWLVPYLGAGSGLEWLSVHTNDFRTDQSVTTTYVNWAWEGWVGLGFRMSPRLRMKGELFYNGGSLENAAVDPNGPTEREVVNVNGVGARLGLDLMLE